MNCLSKHDRHFESAGTSSIRMGTLGISGGSVLLPDLSVRETDVVVDTDSGEILSIGSGEGDEVLDASGGLVMPGLVNAHTHVAMTLLRGYADDKPLRAWLEEDIWPVEAHLSGEDVAAGAALGVLEMIKSGATAFADMYFFMEEVASVVDRAGLRAVLGHGIVTVGKEDEEALEDVEEGVRFAEEYAGSADGRVATALMPHSLATVREQDLREIAAVGRKTGLPVHYHANETVTHQVEPVVESQGIRPLVFADELGLLREKDFVAHGVHLTREEIELLAVNDASVVHCPASNMKLASGMAPVQELWDSGVRVGIGTDGAASNNDLSMFGEIRDAAMIGKLAAGDASALSAEMVIDMATRCGARALGFGSGVIAEGENADLIVIDVEKPHLKPLHSVVSHIAYAVSGADVRHSVCDGSVLMRDREVMTLDEGVVMETAVKRADALVDQVTS